MQQRARLDVMGIAAALVLGWVAAAACLTSPSRADVGAGDAGTSTDRGKSDPQTAPRGLSEAERLENVFSSVAERVSPSVVSIRVESPRRRGRNLFEFGPFGFEMPGEGGGGIMRGLGSGTVTSRDGAILTNAHVVADAQRIEVVLQDGRRLLARKLGMDPATDLALVKVNAGDLRPATFADSAEARVGQWAIAIGSPFGLDYTVTVGVLSATGRGGIGSVEIEDYLQTDASINPGNSGGPLVDLQGNVLGVNTMIVGEGTGIGFAIPSNLARNVAEQLREHGKVRRSYIGVTFQELTPELARELEATGKQGAVVSEVDPNGPAAKAELRPGDVVVSVDGQALRESQDLQRLVIAKPIGADLQLGYLRNGEPRSATLRTAERPTELARRPDGRKQPGAPGPAGETFGMAVRSLTPELARQLGVRTRRGVVVLDVADGSPAARAGLQQGDVIVEADRDEVDDVEDLEEALEDGESLVRVERRGGSFFAVLQREPEPPSENPAHR